MATGFNRLAIISGSMLLAASPASAQLARDSGSKVMPASAAPLPADDDSKIISIRQNGRLMNDTDLTRMKAHLQKTIPGPISQYTLAQIKEAVGSAGLPQQTTITITLTIGNTTITVTVSTGR